MISTRYTSPAPGSILSLCPERPSDLGIEIPGDAWRKGQRESIALIIHAFWAGQKYVLAGITTGGGKTLIAAAVQMILSNEGSSAGGRSLALTHTIQLQAQYLKTLRTARTVTGRSNHLCDLPPDDPAKFTEAMGDKITAANAPCATGDGCSLGLNKRHGCGYYAQMWDAADSPMTVMNYAYAARVIPIPTMREYVDGRMETIPNPFRRDLLVLDECHLAHDVLVEAAGRKLWMRAMREAGISESIPPVHTQVVVDEGRKQTHYENVALWISWATGAHETVAAKMQALRASVASLKTSSAENTANDVVGAVQLAKTKALLTTLAELRDGLRLLSGIGDPDEWIVRRDFGRNNQLVSITVQPIWGWKVIPQMLFRHFNRVLLMSATPGDPDVTRVIMGIPEGEFTYIERPSTFPVQNRPVFYYPVAKLNYQSGDLDWQKVARAIYTIASNPENLHRKGIVHSGSAANARRIVALLNQMFRTQRAFTHGAGENLTREGALTEFTTTLEPRILVTASFTTGLDLPYVIGWQVIAKVPYGNLGDDLTSRRRAFKLADGRTFGQTYYAAQSMNTVVQAAGRIVRSPTDSGPTFILDQNYAMLHATAYKPQFYSEAFRRIEVAGKEAT